MLLAVNFAFINLPFYEEETYRAVREEIYGYIRRDSYKIFGVEISPKHVQGAKLNVVSAKVEDAVKIIEGDATKLEKFMMIAPKKVVVNLPYGIRSAKPKVLSNLYTRFLSSLSKITKGCTIVALTTEKPLFKEAAKEAGIELIDERWILHGNLQAYILKCSL